MFKFNQAVTQFAHSDIIAKFDRTLPEAITFTLQVPLSPFTFTFAFHFQAVMQFACADIVAIFDQTLAEL